jgi:hypothetical protein
MIYAGCMYPCKGSTIGASSMSGRRQHGRGEITWSYDQARKISRGERDHALALDASTWPPRDGLDGWRRGSGHLFRYIENGPLTTEHGKSRGEDREIATPLREAMLRFPSAPIRGVQRRHEYHDEPDRPLSMHTLRVLTSRDRPERIERIFLFHNGLNELDRTGLYYQLASQIIASQAARSDLGGVACILRPFPGHLTRARHARFAEEPLQRYLWDGSHLFNQFLRYMTETQWFLSALVKRSCYRSPSGAELLTERPTPKRSRLDPDCLSTAIDKAWGDLSEASRLAPESSEGTGDSSRVVQRLPEAPLPPDALRNSITALRDVLSLDAWPDLGAKLALPEDGSQEEPSLHVVGYSLGGFTAQSVFMSWPFVVSSCSTLLSGGALRELSPTAFAHPEEWQTVLPSLRYELDEGMLNRRYVVSKEKVAGLSRELFHYFQRTFYEVFEQEYRGAFESRIKAFRQRMLFVLGGDDPIVRPDTVLDSAPSGGMNVVEIGGLGHFLGKDPKGSEERRQREFWLPEVGNLIGRFSAEVARRHFQERPRVWLNNRLEVPRREPPREPGEKVQPHVVRRLSDRRRLEIPGDGALSNRLFGLCLDDLLARQHPTVERESNPDSGLLLVLRNEVPTLLLKPLAVQRRARAIYHDDDHIAKYCRDIQTRAAAFEAGIAQATMVIPWNSKRLMEYLDPPHRFPSQSETAVGHLTREMDAGETWLACEGRLAELADRAKGSVIVFDGRRELQPGRAADDASRALVEAQRAPGPLFVPSLPDCWLWMHAEFLSLATWGGHTVMSVRELFAAEVAKLVTSETTKREEAEERLADHLQKGQIRVLTVSRARYNPRFRGRLVLDTRAVKQTLLHAALCIAVGHDYAHFDMGAGELRSDISRN